MASPSVKFFNGHSMPLVGLGTWQSDNPQELETALDEALKLGYRHIDTAYMYGNEDIIGDVLKRWIDGGKIKREELFIVTKLPPIGMRPEHVPHFLEKQLKSLKLDYVDLYLIHLPIGFQYVDDKTLVPMNPDGKVNLDMSTNLEAIWGAFEAQVEKGLVRSIGISNFNRRQIKRIMKVAKIQPANHQIELHAYFQRPELLAACKKHNITIVAYAPIGSPGRKELYAKRGLGTFQPLTLLEDPVTVSIAKNHSRTPAQILMKFWVQQDVAVIPKSTNPARLRQNFELFDFQLTPVEIHQLKALDKGPSGRSFGGVFPGMSEHPEASLVSGD